MSFKPILNETTQYLGAQAYYHNNIDIEEWYQSDDVDLIQKLAIQFAYFYSSSKNKDKAPEDRIDPQNPYLAARFDAHEKSIQAVLLKMEQMGLIKRQFRNAHGEWFDNQDGSWGLTKRRIILDTRKLKDLLSTLPEEIVKSGYEPRSRERRFIARRPITIISDVINSVIKTQVQDLNARKQKLNNGLLKKQYKQFGSFTTSMSMDEMMQYMSEDRKDAAKQELIEHIALIIQGRPEDLITAITDGQQ